MTEDREDVRVTDATVEAAWRVIHKDMACDCRECIRKALIAALTQSDAEPVAWRYAYPDYPNQWNITSDKLTADERRGNAGCIVEPLYTALAPRPRCRQERGMNGRVEFNPVKNDRGEVELYDIYVEGVWIGSRRTIAQCKLAVKCHAH